MDHDSAVAAQIAEFAHREALPPAFIEMATQWYWPLCQDVAAFVKGERVKILGISGTQGSGKSTLASLLCFLLEQQQNIRVVTLSLDDFYLTRTERQELAVTVHPLFATRGVPGTHDIPLATNTIKQLLCAGEVTVPRFDKALDDRLPQAPGLYQNGKAIQAPVDVIIVEGWCLCIPPQTEAQLQTAVNELEAKQDPDGRWRHAVNQALMEYQAFFHLIDFLIYLKSPDFAAVARWRGQQEQKLARTVGLNQASRHPEQATRIMDTNALAYFLQHYQRLTLHGFNTLPAIADVMFVLNNDQQIIQRVNHQ